MADKNNQKSKKKYKWFGIILIVLLLLFIGLTGYYLEKDLEPVPENQIAEKETVEKNEVSSKKNNLDSQKNNIDSEESNIDSEEASIDSEESSIGSEEASIGSEENNIDKDSKEKLNNSEISKTDSAEKIESIEETPSVSISEEEELDDIDKDDFSESENKKKSQSNENPDQKLEEPSLIDRILSILGLSESDFSQNLNILFVGLDDEQSVAVGSIEADSIMLGRLRPEANKMQIEHIDEDQIYQGKLLRNYHNGDIQVAVEDLSKSEIDYYVYVKYQGFEKVIDELGGVKITLKDPVEVPGLGLNLKEGDNLLSGKEALNFVRWRDSDSLARFERQKILINAVMQKLKSNNILFNVKELYNTIVESYNSVETDINPVLAAEIFSFIRENDNLELDFIE